MVAHTFSHSTQEIEADEFQANPVYIVSSRVARLYSKDLSLPLFLSHSLLHMCVCMCYIWMCFINVQNIKSKYRVSTK